jgi:sulfite exporter TauE/SafE/copper chaperone CopZ
MKSYTFYVSGTHCASCKILIEDILREEKIVSNVQVNLNDQTITVDSNETNTTTLAKMLSEKIKDNGYSVSTEKVQEEKKGEDNLWQAILIGLIFLVAFYMLQKSGVLNFGIGGQLTPTTAFLVGLVASVSTCLAVVGGLILSLSAKVSQDDKHNKKSIYLFHVGRMLGFAVLGGLLGLLGKGLGVNYIFSSVLGILAALIMIVLGLNLVGVFKQNKFTLPPTLFSFFRKIEHQTLAPLLLGIGTFFLPCGFTQSMQVSALSSGSFMSGSLVMFFFALGTLPMLALLSFGASSFANSKYASLFFKSAGVVVLGLGSFAVLSGLVGLGIINPLFNI